RGLPADHEGDGRPGMAAAAVARANQGAVATGTEPVLAGPEAHLARARRHRADQRFHEPEAPSGATLDRDLQLGGLGEPEPKPRAGRTERAEPEPLYHGRPAIGGPH